MLQFQNERLANILPSYYIIFCISRGSREFPELDINNVPQSTFRTLFRSANAPLTPFPLLFLRIGNGRQSHKPSPLFLYCWHCHKDKVSIRLDCSSYKSCASSAMEAFRLIVKDVENLPWVFKLNSDLEFQTETAFCPMELSTKKDCVLDSVTGLTRVLAAKSNITRLREHAHASDGDGGIANFSGVHPRLLYMSHFVTPLYPVDVILTGKSSDFRFITSDSVSLALVYSSIPDMLTTPFDMFVWLLLLATAFVLGTCISSMISNSFSCNLLLLDLLSIFSPLLDQYVPFTSAAGGHEEGEPVNSLVRRITIIWLLACIIFTNSYKGIHNSKYLLDPEY